MSFTLFEEPKILKMERVAKHLVSTLKELCTQKWSKYLVLVGDGVVDTPEHMDLINFTVNQIVEMPRFTRPKDHFSWDLTPFVLDGELAKENAKNSLN